MPDTSPVVLDREGQLLRNGDYTALNNQWGVPAGDRNTPGYQQSLTLASAGDLPNGVTMRWAFPDFHPSTFVWGYPEVFWGGQFGSTVPQLTARVGDIDTLEVKFAIQDASTNSDVLLEIWTTDDSGKQTTEIGVFVYGWGNNDTVPYSDAFISGKMNLNANGGGGGSGTWRFVTLRTTGDLTSGTISFSNILKDLVARGIVNPNDHVSGVELGAEMSKGAGLLQVDRFSVYEAVKQPHLITFTGTTAGQVFDITTNNDYRIDGGPSGAGSDAVRIDAPFVESQVTLAGGHIDIAHARYGDIDIANVGQVRFSDYALKAASLSADRSGADVLQAAAGDTVIRGGAGGDTITGWSGAAYLRGDEGDDLIVGGSGFDDINGNMGDDVARGGEGGDWVVGGRDNDQLYGEAGDDVVYGNMGQDTCDGGVGADTVRGGQADDLVLGGAGNDWLSGDRGADTITGGSGADIFHGQAGSALDRITDFNPAEGDRVQLDPGLTYTVTQTGADTVVDLGGGDQLVLVGVQKAQLTGAWVFQA